MESLRRPTGDVATIARIYQNIVQGRFDAAEHACGDLDDAPRGIWEEQVRIARIVHRALQDRDPRLAGAEAKAFAISDLVKHYRERIDSLAQEMGQTAAELAQEGHRKRARRVTNHLPKTVRTQVKEIIEHADGKGATASRTDHEKASLSALDGESKQPVIEVVASTPLDTPVPAQAEAASEASGGRANTLLDAICSELTALGKAPTDLQAEERARLLDVIAAHLSPVTTPQTHDGAKLEQATSRAQERLPGTPEELVEQIDRILKEHYGGPRRKDPTGLTGTERGILLAVFRAQERGEPYLTRDGLANITGRKPGTVSHAVISLHQYRLDHTPWRLHDKREGVFVTPRATAK